MQMSQENPFQIGGQLDFLLELCPVNSKLGHVADGILHVVEEGVHGQVDEEDPVRMLSQVLVPPVIRIREI